MIRAVLDTNTIVSGIGWSGPPQKILDTAVNGDFVLLTSPDLLEELRRVLSYPRLHALPQDRVQEVLALLPLVAQIVETEEKISVIRQDPADNRVRECAVAGEATHVVTGDEHLLRLKFFRGIKITTPTIFLRLLNRRK